MVDGGQGKGRSPSLVITLSFYFYKRAMSPLTLSFRRDAEVEHVFGFKQGQSGLKFHREFGGLLL